MGRDSKPRKSVGRIKTISNSDKRHRKSRCKRREDEVKANNANNLATESVKTRQIQSSKEFGAGTGTETCRKTLDARSLDRDRPLSRMQLQRFEEFTRDAVKLGVKGILDEYATHLKPYVPPDITRTAFDANPKKNRYSDVVCADGSRVVLRNHTTDYIHANFVRGFC
uniref:Tyrosine-protein phosphatase domain-containing protein n=1 Tax=Panagrolaimus davidi TaxID=227884 RepID=A0A914QQZ4_9BILA